MKKIVIAIAACAVMAMCLVAMSGCSGNSKELASLAQHTWYVTDTSVNAVNVLRFSEDGNVTLVSSFVDGNGVHEGSEQKGTAKFNNNTVTVAFDGSSEKFELPYTFEDGVATLDPSQCLTEEQVLEKIQGNWSATPMTYVLGKIIRSAYNIKFSGTTMEYEYATASSVSQYDYFYYGPYSGEFTLGNGTFVSDIHGASEFFFRIEDGDVQLFHYSNEFTRGGELVGQDGYSF